MAAAGRNGGLVAEPLFVAVTRPPMRWGVTYTALLLNFVFTMEVFLLSRNLLTLLLAVPVHAICALVCLKDPRFFDLLALWLRTRLAAWLTSGAYWRASSTNPLPADLPDGRGRRRAAPSIALVSVGPWRF